MLLTPLRMVGSVAALAVILYQGNHDMNIGVFEILHSYVSEIPNCMYGKKTWYL